MNAKMRELIEQLLALPEGRLSDAQREAFQGMLDRGWPLTDKQLHWVNGVAERLGLQVAPSENLFSAMSPEKQAAQRARAKGILPWEK